MNLGKTPYSAHANQSLGVTIRTSAGQHLATVYAGEGAYRMDDVARLFAAAPDLLKACELAEQALGDLGACEDEPCQCSGALPKVRAAIAKAKGL